MEGHMRKKKGKIVNASNFNIFNLLKISLEINLI